VVQHDSTRIPGGNPLLKTSPQPWPSSTRPRPHHIQHSLTSSVPTHPPGRRQASTFRWTIVAMFAQHVHRSTVLLRYLSGYPASLDIFALTRPPVQDVTRLQTLRLGIPQTSGPYGAGPSGVAAPGLLPAEEADSAIVLGSPQVPDHLTLKKHGQVVDRFCRRCQVGVRRSCRRPVSAVGPTSGHTSLCTRSPAAASGVRLPARNSAVIKGTPHLQARRLRLNRWSGDNRHDHPRGVTRRSCSPPHGLRTSRRRIPGARP
jgi:hypothetical protein